MKRFVLTARAQQDVSDIWDYIADDNIDAAGRVLDALNGAMVKLATSPGIGHWREERRINATVSFWSIRT
jgi:plasmid stabilization system protein ParE